MAIILALGDIRYRTKQAKDRQPTKQTKRALKPKTGRVKKNDKRTTTQQAFDYPDRDEDHAITDSPRIKPYRSYKEIKAAMKNSGFRHYNSMQNLELPKDDLQNEPV